MFCPKCGTKQDDDSRFCHSCGADLSEYKYVAEPENDNTEAAYTTAASIVKPRRKK